MNPSTPQSPNPSTPETTGTKSLVGAGLLAALAASLCCITPILAVLGGIGGVASTFSWLEPFRPYLIALTVGVLGFAWYQKLKPRPVAEMDCACEVDEKPSLMQSKGFLAVVTVLAAVLLAFPYFSGSLLKNNAPVATAPVLETVQARLSIAGMNCAGCEVSVNHALNATPGVLTASSSFSEGKAVVKFDQRKVSADQLAQAVTKETGYAVTKVELVPK